MGWKLQESRFGLNRRKRLFFFLFYNEKMIIKVLAHDSSLLKSF